MTLRLVMQHPIILFGAIIWLVRALSILAFYHTDASMREPWESSFLAISIHSVFFFALIFGLMILWTYLKRLRKFIHSFSAIIFILTLIASNTDLILLRLTGNKFTPEVLQFYGLKYVLHPNVLGPIMDNPITVFLLLSSLAIMITMFVIIVKKMNKKPLSGNYSKSVLWSGFVILICLSAFVESKSQLYLHELRPPEIVFAKSWLGTEEYVPDKIQIKKSNELVRRHLDISEEDQIYEDFPILRKVDKTKYTFSETGSNLPDIFIIVVESLRGNELAFTKSAKDHANTPVIDSLARHSLIFPRFISNGWPSEQGFFSTITSSFPHRLKHIAVNYKQNIFDCLPKRLEEMGYETKSIWGILPADRVLNWSRKWFNHTIHPKPRVWHDSDLVFYKKTIMDIEKYDSTNIDKPLFMYIQNGDTHMPFDPTSGFFENDKQKEEAQAFFVPGDKHSRDRYKRTLEWTDQQLGKLLRHLSKRKRADNTIVLLMGDHSILTNESFDPGVKVAPTNPFVHTGALISGSEEIFGNLPVEMDFPASQVDVMPTILSLVGYDKPIASWGQNLLSDKPVSERNSISVRPGVFRMDKGRSTLYLNALNPANYWFNDFYDLSYEKKMEAKDNFTEEERYDLYSMMYYWSYMLENDLILPKASKIDQ